MSIPATFADRFVRDSELLQRKQVILFRGRDEFNGQGVTLHVFPLSQATHKKQLVAALTQAGRMRDLQHPALVPLVACGFEQDCLFLVTKPLTACSLRSMIQEQGGPLSLEVVLDTFFLIAEVVSVLHTDGVVHGRISSESVLVNEQGAFLGGYYPTALDTIDPEQALIERAMVSPAYLAPEYTARTEPGPRVDVYALGALLYEAATGQPPPATHTTALADEKVAHEPLVFPAKRNPQIPPLLDAAIVKALSEDPAGRFSSIEELRSAVAVAVGKQTDLVGQQGAIGLQQTVLRSGEAIDPVQNFVAREFERPPTERFTAFRPIDELAERLAVEASLATERPSGASFIMLNGPLRGERYWVESDLVMIGSDPQCGIHVKGKEVALHHAVVSQKQDQLSISGLTPSGLTVNGQKIPGRSEAVLTQGDVVFIGKNKLRFVAPEKLTELVQEPSAPSVDEASPHAAGQEYTEGQAEIDDIEEEPQEQGPKMSAVPFVVAGVSLLVAAGALLYALQKRVVVSPEPHAVVQQPVQQAQNAPAASATMPAVPDAAEVAVQTRQLLAKVQEYRVLGQITGPPGANARDLLLDLRSRDPENDAVRTIYRNMAADAVAAGDLARDAGRTERMRKSYAIARDLGLDPEFLHEREVKAASPATDGLKAVDTAGWGLTRDELESVITSDTGSKRAS